MKATLNVESRDPALATKIDIPDFTAPPAIVVWGKRFFIFDFDVPNNDLDNLTYVETSGYVIPATQG